MNEDTDKNDIADSSHIISTNNDDVEYDAALCQPNPISREKNGSNYLFLYFCAVIACMVSSVKIGFIIVWISPVAKQLLSDDPNVNPLGAPTSTVHISCIGAIPATTFTIGSLVLSKVIDRYGRKRGIIMMGLPVIFLEICMAFATNILMIYIPLSILSFILGGLSAGGRVYLTEISEEHNRSKVVCIGVLGMPFGNVCSYLIASCGLSFTIFTLACSIPFIISVGCWIILLPESPVYLVARKKPTRALVALKKLRNKSSDELQEELRVISYILEETSQSKDIGFTSMFTDRTLRRALFLSFVIHVLTFSDGASPMMTYLIRILDESGSSIPNYISNNSLTITQLFFSLMAIQISEKYGRKTLLYASLSCNAVSLFSVALYFYLKSIEFTYTDFISFWPLFGLTVFYISNSLGLSSVCWVFTSEIFPNNVMSMAMALLGSVDSMAASLGVFSFPLIAEAFGIQWNFCCYGMVCIIGYIFVYFKLPETRGKSLIEIQAILKK